MAYFVEGITTLANIQSILLIAAGVFIGIVFGALPGLNTAMAVCLCLPLTFALEAADGIAMIMGVFIGGVSGGLISAILLNIPGTTAAMATTFDGYPMARNGQAGRAMGIGIFYSFVGTVIGMAALITLSKPMAAFALKFTSVEYFAIAVFSLTMMASLSGQSILKGLVAGCLGIFIALVGTAPVDYTARFAFGFSSMEAGFSTVSVLTGSFAISTIMNNIKNPNDIHSSDFHSAKMKGFGFSVKELGEQTGNMVRSAVIGVAIGILPGVGAGTSNLIAYSTAKNSSKHPEKFGTGIMDGIVASETANNATVCGAIIPLLTLGIPGDIGTAFLLSALMIHGISPGPLLFHTNPELIYICFAGLLIAAVFMLIFEYFGIRLFTKVLTVRQYILLPLILILCSVGAFGGNNRTFDVVWLIIFGLMGYMLQHFKFPMGPMVIGFILGGTCETNLRRALMIRDGNVLALFESPIALFFYGVAAVFLVISVRNTRKAQLREETENSKDK